MDLNDLLIFKKVVDTGGFTRAGVRLGMPKSTVSQRVAALEADLNARLLHRTTRRVTLTDTGQTVYQTASRIEAEAGELGSILESAAKVPAGVLRLSMPPDFGHHVIINLLPGFLRKYPDLEVEVDLSNRFVDLVGENFDLAVRATESALRDSTLISVRLAVATMGVYAAPAVARRYKEAAAPPDLNGAPAVWFGPVNRRDPPIWRLGDGSRLAELTVKPVLRTNDLMAAKEAVAAGLGIGLLPTLLWRDEIRRRTLIPMIPGWQGAGATIYAVCPSRRHMPLKTKVMIDWLREGLPG